VGMFFLLLSAVAAMDATQQFEMFREKYNKTYLNSQEYTRRLEIFQQNLVLIAEWNANHVKIGGGEVYGVTMFADLTQVEFKAQYLTQISNYTGPRVSRPAPAVKATKIDWRTKGAVSYVKDQAACGSCWAFSAVEAIESFAFLNGHGLHGLSPSQIVECDTKGMDRGCNGGVPSSAISYVHSAGGIMKEADYPYRNGKGGVGACEFQPSKVAVKVKGAAVATKGESSLEHEIEYGPPSICIAADSWQMYTGGIIMSCPGQIDHAVQLVALDKTSATHYWTVKNSWSTGWGEHGFIRVAYGSDLCYISQQVSYPLF